MPAAWSARGNSWGKGAAGGGVGAPAGTGRSQRTPAALLQGVAGRPSWGWGKGPPGLGSWASKLVRGGRELGIAATVSKARLLRTEEWAWRNQCGRPHSWAPGPSCALGHALVPPWTLGGLINYFQVLPAPMACCPGAGPSREQNGKVLLEGSFWTSLLLCPPCWNGGGAGGDPEAMGTQAAALHAPRSPTPSSSAW